MASKRRGNGSGSIRQKPDGRWEGRYTDAEGKRCSIMGKSYDDVRPLSDDERTQWPALLRAAALRFWVSRLHDLHLPRPGELTHAHDPAEFERILRDRIATSPAYPAHGEAA